MTNPSLDELHDVPQHMRRFAIGLFGHALWHSVMTGRESNPWSEQFGILHVAHGGELLIKSAIAQTHPLAIFTKPPKYDRSGNSHLSFADLVRSARTVGYQDLPALLEEKTGYKLPDQEIYREVGTLRNVVQHFTVPNAEYARLVLTFLCKVADPLLARFWPVEIFREIYQYWGEDDYYLFRDEPWFAEALERHGIQYSGWLPTPETVG